MTRESIPTQGQAQLPPPSSILIVGAGVFGLSTAHSLLSSSRYNSTNITIIDAYAPDVGPESAETLPAKGRDITASLDTSRIVRADYTDPTYARLADEATGLFRAGWAEDPTAHERTYSQAGLLLMSTGPEAGRGRRFVEGTYANVLDLATAALGNNTGVKPIQLPGPDDVAKVLKCSPSGLPALTTGYINPQAGWAHASAGVAAARKRVIELSERRRAGGSSGQFKYLANQRVTSLIFSESKTSVTGVNLETGNSLTADFTILATGSWSSILLPTKLAPRLRASGQVLSYIPLTTVEEVARYAGRPTVLDMETGMFAIFPPEHYISERRGQAHIKIARHGWGYANPQAVKDPISGETVECHLPLDSKKEFYSLPPEGRRACRAFARIVVPELCPSPSESSTEEIPFPLERTCWYADTPTGDFLIDFIPDLAGVMIVTGGSGHGYKFLPVLGDKVVERLEGRLESDFAIAWRWRTDDECRILWDGEGDCSRGGERGMLWAVETKQ